MDARIFRDEPMGLKSDLLTMLEDRLTLPRKGKCLFRQFRESVH